jgi:hypothetical protein
MKSLFSVIACSTLATAVCVNGHVSVTREYSRSTYVLIASVVAANYVPAGKDGYDFDGTNYTLRSVQLLKGDPPPTFDVFSENSSGRFVMATGERYLVFVYREHGNLRIDNCGNSGLLSASSLTLAKVRNLMKH